MTVTPHLFFRLELEMDGRRRWGTAADHLPPKWFTKNPDTSYRDDVTDMLAVIRAAADFAARAGPCASVFDLWQKVHAAQADWCAARQFPPLLGGFGVSLVERAAIDAFCRLVGRPFHDLARENVLGIDFDPADPNAPARYPELAGAAPADYLPRRPLREVIARHTVGLGDPLTDADVPPGERLDDGLPQSLEACIAAYGLTHFKIKLSGDVGRDLDRLRRLADLIGRHAGARAGPGYAFTLDGNENFRAPEPFRRLWHALAGDAGLGEFMARLIFVEQPLHRDVALGDEVRREMLAWPDRPPLIIDESDATPHSLRRALECGYAGTSHKNCKGIFKSLANACLLERLRRRHPGRPFILSGEDLSNVGPVALMQDLAVAAGLGIPHVERNGHHYFKGLSMFPPEIGDAVLRHHGDLYRRQGGGPPGVGNPSAPGFATVDVRGGRLRVGSTVDAPFGVGFELDPSPFVPADRWTFDSLEAGG